MATRRSKSYFWSNSLPRGIAYDRFMSRNRPSELIFGRLFDSIPFINDAADTAQESVAGHAMRASLTQVKNRTAFTSSEHSRFVMPEHLPANDGSINSIVYDSTNNQYKLDGDNASPGNWYMYCSNGSGTKGWNLISTVLASTLGVKESIEFDSGSIHLVGDSASPGNYKIYGTSGAGTKGWNAAGTFVKNSLIEDSGQIHLVGDSASPGNYYIYGTDGAGTKGWQEFDSVLTNNTTYSSLSSQVSTNVSNIATNVTNISNNAGDITTLQSDVSDIQTTIGTIFGAWSSKTYLVGEFGATSGSVDSIVSQSAKYIVMESGSNKILIFNYYFELNTSGGTISEVYFNLPGGLSASFESVTVGVSDASGSIQNVQFCGTVWTGQVSPGPQYVQHKTDHGTTNNLRLSGTIITQVT